MSAVEKTEVLARVASSSLPKREVLSELGVPRSTYYRWLRGREHRRHPLEEAESTFGAHKGILLQECPTRWSASNDAGVRRKHHTAPSHISNMVLSIAKIGPPTPA